MWPEKNQDDEYGERLEQEETVPQHVRGRIDKFVFKEGAHGKIDGIPDADEQVGPLPDFGYVINPLQTGNLLVKINDS